MGEIFGNERRALIWFILLAGMVGLTLGLFVGAGEQRYLAVGENLACSDPGGAGPCWRLVDGRSGMVRAQGRTWTLEIAPGKDADCATVLQTIELPRPGLYRVSAEVDARGIVPGGKRWHGGRLLLVTMGLDGKANYKLPHVVKDVSDTHGWLPADGMIRVGSDISRAIVGMQLAGLSGRLAARNIEVRRVEERRAFVGLKWALALVWLLLLLAAGYQVFSRNWRKFSVVITLLIMAAILVGTLLPNRHITQISSTVLDLVDSSKAVEGEIPPATENEKPRPPADGLIGTQLYKTFATVPIKKTGHFVFFALLFLTCSAAQPDNIHPVQIVLFCIVFALCTETLQFFTPDRGPRVGDVLIDVAGVMLGVGIKMGAGRYVRKAAGRRRRAEDRRRMTEG